MQRRIAATVVVVLGLQLCLFTSGRRVLHSNDDKISALILSSSAWNLTKEQHEPWSTTNEELHESRSSQSQQQQRRRLDPVNADDHLVKNLPGLKATDIVHYAGHLTVDPSKEGNLFYWLIEAQTVDPTQAPLLIWLNGGPGCSSMDGLFLELGPFRLDGDKLDQIKINPYSWHNAANLLFVDQPVGTGLSFTKSQDGYVTSDAQVNDHFYKFLTAFFNLHTKYTYVENGKRKTRKFFISGESHAGHYIPTMSANILKKNIEMAASTDPKALIIDLQGIALGNPWTDPYNQYDVSDFSLAMGLINTGQRNRLKEMNRECQTKIKQGKFNQRICFSLLDDVIDSTSLSGSHKVLMYDARKFVHSTGVFPPGHEAVEKYLNRPEVKAALHATATTQPYVECADPPFLALQHQDGRGVTGELIETLNSGMKVLVYSGQFDIICNHMGSERMMRELEWVGRDDWLKAQPGVWLVDKNPAGYITQSKNLMSLLVLNCGHMVPMDEPKVALDMISRFLYGKDFSSGNSMVGVSLLNPDDLRCDHGLAHRNTPKHGGGLFWPQIPFKTQIPRPARQTSAVTLAGNVTEKSLSVESLTAGAVCREKESGRQPSHESDSLQSRSATSSCSVSLSFKIGPLEPQPWTAADAFVRYRGTLKDLLAIDVRTALAMGASINGSWTVETTESAVETAKRLELAGLSITTFVEDEASQESAGTVSDQTFTTSSPRPAVSMLSAIVTIHGPRLDVLAAISSLASQSTDQGSVLRRGILTAFMQPSMELTPLRRRESGVSGDGMMGTGPSELESNGGPTGVHFTASRGMMMMIFLLVGSLFGGIVMLRKR